AVVEVIRVPLVVDRHVPAAGAVPVRVPLVFLAIAHGNSLRTVKERTPGMAVFQRRHPGRRALRIGPGPAPIIGPGPGAASGTCPGGRPRRARPAGRAYQPPSGRW